MHLFKFALLLVFPFLLQEQDLVQHQVKVKPLPILEKRLSMTIHSAEILESVIARLQANTGENVKYSTYELLPYHAKAKVYEQVTVKEILEHQLQGTPIRYKLQRKKLIIYKSEK
jgi:uncharacterized protein (UPF0179 family)